MSEQKIPIPAMLYNVAVGGHVTNSQQIIDENENKEQSQINAEVKQNLGQGGSVDARITQAKNDIIGGASSNGNTLKKVEDRVSPLESAVGTGGSVYERISEEGAKHYLKEETYNKSELNNMITTPNQEYVSVSATAQTTAVTDILPATGAADTVYRVGNWDGSQFDASVYSEYTWNGSSYVHLNTKTQIGEVFDISAYHATGGTFATYADLSAALDSNNGSGVPQSLQKGGMSVKFVQSSDNNYVQYLLTANVFTTNVADWKRVDVHKALINTLDIKSDGIFLSNSYIVAASGKLESSDNYDAYKYTVDYCFSNARIFVHAGANAIVDAVIGFYSGITPTEQNCISTVAAVDGDGVHSYDVEIPQNTITIVVSNRKTTLAIAEVYIYNPKQGEYNLSVDGELYSGLAISKEAYEKGDYYIDIADGRMGTSPKYNVFKYKIDSSLIGGKVIAIAGTDRNNDIALGFYSGEPSAQTCIKIIWAKLGVNTYIENIPANTSVIVVCSKKSIYSEENVKFFQNGNANILNAEIQNIKNIILNKWFTSNSYINTDGSIAESSDYNAYYYLLEKGINRIIAKTGSNSSNNAASIAFYNKVQPTAANCVGVVLCKKGTIVYDESVPSGTVLVIVSTRKPVYDGESVRFYQTTPISNSLNDLEKYKYNHQLFNEYRSYIDSNGNLVKTKNYRAFHFVIKDFNNTARVIAIAGSSDESDAAIAFYSGIIPTQQNCISVVGSVVGLTMYDNSIPSGTKSVVISTRKPIFDAMKVLLMQTSSVDGSFEAVPTIANDIDIMPLNIKLMTFNAGGYTCKGCTKFSDEAKMNYRNLMAHSKPTICALQEDINMFSNESTENAIYKMFRFFYPMGDTSINYKDFASDFPLTDVRMVRYTDMPRVSHYYFLAGEFYINGKCILIISIHFDWQDITRRSVQRSQVIAYTQNYDYAIVMGDTNCEDYVDGVRQSDDILLNEWDDFIDAGFQMANNGYFGLKNTIILPEGSLEEPLDNIFVKGNIEINSFDVIKKDWMEDHYLVEADVTIYTY